MEITANAGNVIDAGVLDYSTALKLMKNIVDIKQKKQWPEVLMLLEHPEVITLGRRATTKDILLDDKELQDIGITIHNVERGGLATYHGPGQLLGYIIMDLENNDMSPSLLVNHIEKAIIQTLKFYKINAEQRHEHRGVWVGSKKIASVGIAVQRGITFHGFALNCNPELSHFDFINPCGLGPGSMTSIARITKESISPNEIKPILTKHLESRVGINLSMISLDRLISDVRREQK